MPEPVLSQRTLNRTLLARQLLLEPAAMAPLDAVEHLVGLQAQLPTSPYIALRARLAGFDPAVLSTAMEERRAVRIVLMRGTIHLVSIDDALLLRPVIQPVLDRELLANRTWAQGIEGVDLEPVLALGRALVEERPRSLAELRTELGAQVTHGDPGSLAYAVRNLAADAPGHAARPVGSQRRGEADDGRGLGRAIRSRRTRTRSRRSAAISPPSGPRPSPTCRRGPGSPACAPSSSACARPFGRIATSAAASCSTSRTRRSRTPSARPASASSPTTTTRSCPTTTGAGSSRRSRGRSSATTSPRRSTWSTDSWPGSGSSRRRPARASLARLVIRPLVEHTADEEAAIFAEAESLATFLATADPGVSRPAVRRLGEGLSVSATRADPAVARGTVSTARSSRAMSGALVGEWPRNAASRSDRRHERAGPEHLADVGAPDLGRQPATCRERGEQLVPDRQRIVHAVQGAVIATGRSWTGRTAGSAPSGSGNGLSAAARRQTPSRSTGSRPCTARSTRASWR